MRKGICEEDRPREKLHGNDSAALALVCLSKKQVVRKKRVILRCFVALSLSLSL